MSQLCVFTTGTNLSLLAQSCKDVGIELQTYECDPWVGYVSGKVRGALSFLDGRREPYVMWVDGNDSLVLQSEEDILARYTAICDPVLIAAEKNCWPDADKADEYPRLWVKGPRYINSGGYIGRRDIVMTALHAVLQASVGEDDQRAWTRAYLVGVLPNLQIDHSRWIFSCVGDGGDAIHANSCVMHFNGRTPGREEYYAKVCQERAEA